MNAAGGKNVKCGFKCNSTKMAGGPGNKEARGEQPRAYGVLAQASTGGD